MNLRTKADEIKITKICGLRKCKVFFCLLGLLIGFTLNAQARIITVTAEGSGTTKNEAIRDAMQDAIRKAVGTYVVSRRGYQLQESDAATEEYSEELYDVSEAHVENYNVLNTKWENGILTVKIQAKVVPNEYLKYVPKRIITELTQKEVGNMQNTQNMLQQSKGIIKEFFKDYWLYLYTLKLDVGQAQPEDIDKNGNITAWRAPITATVNQNAFMQLHQRLSQFLGKVCRAKCSIYVRNGEVFPEGIGDRMWKSAGLKGDLDDNNYVFICLEVVRSEGVHYTFYLIPKLILRMIYNEISYKRWRLIVSLLPKNAVTKAVRDVEILYDLRFWYENYFMSFRVDGSTPLIFVLQNKIFVEGFEYKDNNCQKMEVLSIPLGDEDYEVIVYPIPITDNSTDEWETLAEEAEQHLKKIKASAPRTEEQTVSDDFTLGGTEEEVIQIQVIEEPEKKVCRHCQGEKFIKCRRCTNGRCPSCRGRGGKERTIPDLHSRSWVTTYVTCRSCNGTGSCRHCQNGRVICSKCNGRGFFLKKR